MTNDEKSSNDELRGDEQPNEPPSVDYEDLDGPRVRFLFATLLAFASPFLIDGLCYAIAKELRGGDTILTPMLAGVVVAKLSLMAIWLAWGGSRTIWRMLVVMGSMILSGFVAPMMGADLHFEMEMFLLGIICSSMLALPRWFGVRWILPRTSRNGTSPTSATHQFSILDVFVWTTMAALVAGLLRWNGFPRDFNPLGFIFTLIGIAVFALILFIILWAALSPPEPIVRRVLAAYILPAAVILLIGGASRAPGEVIVQLLTFVIAAVSATILPLYILRFQGHRLVGRRIGNYAADVLNSELKETDDAWKSS